MKTIEFNIDEGVLKRIDAFAAANGTTREAILNDAADGLARDAGEMIRAMCSAYGYTDYIEYPSGRDACIGRFAFTFAILADMTTDGYGDRWCYGSKEDARAALAAWNGEDDSEPQGWHRHPTTGRRRPDGDAAREFIAP